jgi:uncharacterized protein (DUF1810 family)
MDPSESTRGLKRFVQAQDPIHNQIVEELTAGKKKTHWMWFVFPQLSGLGNSAMSRHYAIGDLAEARRYLAHPVLGTRLRHDVKLLMRHKDRSAREILGTPDDLKFRSCLTLFLEAASDEADRSLFADALKAFYRGEPDPRTVETLRMG